MTLICCSGGCSTEGFAVSLLTIQQCIGLQRSAGPVGQRASRAYIYIVCVMGKLHVYTIDTI